MNERMNREFGGGGQRDVVVGVSAERNRRSASTRRVRGRVPGQRGPVDDDVVGRGRVLVQGTSPLPLGRRPAGLARRRPRRRQHHTGTARLPDRSIGYRTVLGRTRQETVGLGRGVRRR